VIGAIWRIAAANFIIIFFLARKKGRNKLSASLSLSEFLYLKTYFSLYFYFHFTILIPLKSMARILYNLLAQIVL